MLEERYALGSLRLMGKNLFINTPQGRQAAPQTKCSSSVTVFSIPLLCAELLRYIDIEMSLSSEKSSLEAATVGAVRPLFTARVTFESCRATSLFL